MMKTTSRLIASRNRVLDMKKTLSAVVFALGLSYCGGRTAHAQTTNQEAEGTVELWVNKTSTPDDDLVAINGSLPCYVHLQGATQDMKVVLVAPSIANAGRVTLSALGITNNSDGSLPLTLTKNEAWQSFTISGAVVSQNTNDAKIEAHKDTANGNVKATGSASVYMFDPKMIVSVGGYYGFDPSRQYTVITGNGHAVDLVAMAGLKPLGIGNSPQFSNLKIGIIQNATTGSSSVTWKSSTNDFHWIEPAATSRSMQLAPSKLTVVQSKIITASNHLPNAFLDSASGVAPFYDPLQPLTGTGTSRSDDTPSVPYAPAFDLSLKSGEVEVASVRYSVNQVVINDTFSTWAVLQNSTTQVITPVQQTGWTVNVDSSGVPVQKAIPDSPVGGIPATTSPIITPPFANDSNISSAPQPSDNETHNHS